jgi:hypothetical protein
MSINRLFLDTEFIENFTTGLRPRHYIDLISIALVKDSGETYSAISNEYQYEDADDWVKANVIKPLYESLDLAAYNYIDVTNFQKYTGKPNSIIAEEIKDFVGKDPIFYGYFADYDWVLLCSLYGRMINLPESWPMYCRDVQQIIDGENFDKDQLKQAVPQVNTHLALDDAKWIKEAYKYVKEKMKR